VEESSPAVDANTILEPKGYIPGHLTNASADFEQDLKEKNPINPLESQCCVSLLKIRDVPGNLFH